MNKYALPNEVMMSPTEQQLWRKCIDKLSAGSLSVELSKRNWKVTDAKFCETKTFLDEMQFFRSRSPLEYEKLCEAIGERRQIGVFEFQFARTSEMDDLPKNIVGKSLLVCTF